MRYTLIVIAAILAFGCTAATKQTTKSNEIVTTTSSNLLLEPPMAGKNNVIVKISNPTDHRDIDLGQEVKTALIAKGYNVVDYSDQADYSVMGQVIMAGDTELELLEAARRSKYGARVSLNEPKPDLIAQAVGGLLRSARNKTYILILDLKIQTTQKSEKKRIQQKGKTRMVTGIKSTRDSERKIMMEMGKKTSGHIIAMF